MPAERLYHADSHLLQFSARVSDVREYARRDGRQVWQIALDRTAFYPTSGGQPHDTGTLTARARSGTLLTLPVEEVTADSDGEVWHTTAKPLLAGTEVEAAIDAPRRLDHTQQHSGQHLLSAILADQFGAATVSFHLGAEDATIDLAAAPEENADAALAALLAALPEAERRVNQAIAANLPVTALCVPLPEAQAMLAAGLLRKLPELDGDVRVVEIAGLDRNACGGTHVSTLGEIGCLLLRETERVRRTLRLHFVCGGRAVQAARRDWEQLSQAAFRLSVSRDEVPGAVDRKTAEVRTLVKANQQLLEELAGAHADLLAREYAQVSAPRLVERRSPDRDAAYTRLLAPALLRRLPQTAALLVTAGPETASILLGADLPLAGGCGGILKDALAAHGLRGGGAAELAQAQVPASRIDAVAGSVREAVEHAIAALA